MVVSGLVIAALLGVGARLLWLRGTTPTAGVQAFINPSATITSPADPPSSATSPPMRRTPTARPTSSAPCPVGRVEATLPSEAPRDLAWVHGPREPMPVSATYGPGTRGPDGLPECFSHSPTGGVLAAWSINASLFSTEWQHVLETQIAHTSGYPRLVTQLQTDPPDGSPGTTSPAGFAILAADQDAVTVELVLRDDASSALVGCPVTVAWDGNDWQLAPRPDGTVTTPTCPAVEPGSYISWGL